MMVICCEGLRRNESVVLQRLHSRSMVAPDAAPTMVCARWTALRDFSDVVRVGAMPSAVLKRIRRRRDGKRITHVSHAGGDGKRDHAWQPGCVLCVNLSQASVDHIYLSCAANVSLRDRQRSSTLPSTQTAYRRSNATLTPAPPTRPRPRRAAAVRHHHSAPACTLSLRHRALRRLLSA
jgi:hypothetical protein